ncbi:MAG: tol-pal system protein YbgF [Deltaproteobacteria bacterium]|nr:tol-pal system protein YbgF [Deltaproteobacteria bacterium]
MRKISLTKNNITLALLLILTQVLLYGCVTVSTEKGKKEESAITKMTEDLAETKQIISDIGSSRALESADLDIIKEEMAILAGKVDEKDFEIQKLHENAELLTSAVSTLSDRLKVVEEKLKVIATQGIDSNTETSATESTKPNPTTLYMAGLNQVRVEKNYLGALETFRQFISLYPAHELAPNSQYWIGEIYYAQGQWERAVLEFNKAIKNYPKGSKTAAALLKQAFSFEKLDAKNEAKVLLKKVIKKYPKTDEAKQAKNRLKTIK